MNSRPCGLIESLTVDEGAVDGRAGGRIVIAPHGVVAQVHDEEMVVSIHAQTRRAADPWAADEDGAGAAGGCIVFGPPCRCRY